MAKKGTKYPTTPQSTPSVVGIDSLIGQNVIVRTVTYHYTGTLAARRDGYLTLNDAAWIADSGRWSEALRTGTLSEIEPYPGACYVSEAAIVDVSLWPHPLPRTTK
jgi:hypothetical protein